MLDPCSFLLLSSLLPDTLWRQTSSIKEHHCICSRKHLQMQRADRGEREKRNCRGAKKEQKGQKHKKAPKKCQSHTTTYSLQLLLLLLPWSLPIGVDCFQWLHLIYCRALSHKRNTSETVPCERAVVRALCDEEGPTRRRTYTERCGACVLLPLGQNTREENITN
jgi:hypothetical protein